jgi:lipoprotein LprG
VTKRLTSAHIAIGLNGTFDRLGQISRIDCDAQVSPLIVNGMVTYQSGEIEPFVLANDTVSVKLGGIWNLVGATSVLIPSAIIDPRNGLPKILESVTDATFAGSEIINGIDTTKVTGTIPTDQARNILPEASAPAEFTAWIRKPGDPVLVRTTASFNPAQSATVTMSNWNLPVQVTLAPAA